MNDRDTGLRALTHFYRAAGLQIRGYTFDQVVAQYDGQSPSFVSNLGGAVRLSDLTETRVRQSMEALGAASQGRFPHVSDFFEALVDERTSWTFEDTISVVKGTVQDIAGVAKVGAGLYVTVLAIGAVIVLLPTLRRGP